MTYPVTTYAGQPAVECMGNLMYLDGDTLMAVALFVDGRTDDLNAGPVDWQCIDHEHATEAKQALAALQGLAPTHAP